MGDPQPPPDRPIGDIAKDVVASDAATTTGGRQGKQTHVSVGGRTISKVGAIAAVGGGLLLLGIGIGAATLHLGPFAQPGAPVAAVKPYGVGLTGANAELKFAGFVQGACPAPDVKYMSPTFSGGWKVAVDSAAVPTDQSVNMLALPTSPFGVALNGKIGPTGSLDVSGDSSVQFMHLVLMVPLIPPGAIKAPVDVTGSADVKLHFIGSPAIGTVTGDCAGTYQVTGTIAPP